MLTFETECNVASFDSVATAFPQAPRTVEDTGLPFLFLAELVTKVMLLRGQVPLVDLSSHLKLNIGVLGPLIAFLRAEKLCEVTRRGNSGTDADLHYVLTDAGRQRAAEYTERSAYAGPAPVTLAAYCAQVQAQSVSGICVMREDIDNAFSDIVVSPLLLERLGAAMNSGRAIYLHGPGGSGKTLLAERLARLLSGDILVPYAIFVEGEVVQIHDPAVHRQAEFQPEQPSPFDKRTPVDTRWLRCARPAVLTGGELTIGMLDLQHDARRHFYHAPPHLKASNGILVIDDLGRQRCSPTELMNRWIVPLDRHVDFLTLHTGHKFMVPFDVVVVISSNLSASAINDESFLRRLGYKIHVGPLSVVQYRQVFRNACEEYGVEYSDSAFSYLLREHHAREGRALLACYPRDLLAQLRDLALYRGAATRLDEAGLDWAWNNYFKDGAAGPARAEDQR